jgi:dipeptidyl aminopeptidase/acylaminoacyl peptidase
MKIIRFGLLGLLGLSAAGMVALAIAQRDTAATHPALTDLPDLISVQEFFADPGVEWAFEPSMDGTMVSYWTTNLSGNVLKLRDPATGKDLAEFPHAESAYWSPRAPMLRIFQEGRLWEVDPKKPERDDWQDVSPRGINNWYLAREAMLPDGRNLVLSYDRSQIWPDLYTTDPMGRDLQKQAENNGKTLYWLVTSDARIVARMEVDPDGTKRLMAPTNAENWRNILTIPQADDFSPLDISPDGKTITVLTNLGREFIELARLDLTSGQLTTIAGFEGIDVSIAYDLQPLNGEVDLIVGDGLVPKFVAISPNGKALLGLIEAEGTPIDLNYLVSSGQGRFVTATLSPDAKSYVYRHFDLEKDETKDLGTFALRANHLDDLATTEGFLVEARDGLKLSAFVTRPKGVTGPAPTIIEVHGGPMYHRHWEYSHFTQFMANRGYTVISVNYRGSTGWGRAFRDAGFGEFGAKIQEDVVDVAGWAVNEGLADPAAMAVTGDSFGGYTTVMALTRADNPFKVGVAVIPMLDVEFQTRHAPAFWSAAPQDWARYFGDVNDPVQAQRMKDRSPVHVADKIKSPLLMLAGRQDQIVNIEQVERFDEALQAAGGQMELKVFDQEGHGWDYWKTNLAQARLTEDFLAKHLGGRSGGWHWAEWVSQYVD